MNKYAYIIGNDKYTASDDLKLFNAVNDSLKVAKTLKNKGFLVKKFINLNYLDFIKAIQDMENINNDSIGIVFFYYAGHAVQIQDRNYLLPIDIEKNITSIKYLDENSIYLQDITLALDNFNGYKVVVLDACRNSPTINDILYENEIFNKGLRSFENKKNLIVSYSTTVGNTASDSGNYAKILVKNLKQYNSSIEDVFKKTRYELGSIKKYKEQLSWEYSSLVKKITIDPVILNKKEMYSFPCKSDDIDIINTSPNGIIFVGTNRYSYLIFMRKMDKIKDPNNSKKYINLEQPYAQISSYENNDTITNVVFFSDNKMYATSEKGNLFLYELDELSQQERNHGDDNFIRSNYKPKLLVKNSDLDNNKVFPLFDIDINNDGTFILLCGGSNNLYIVDVNNYNSVDKIRYEDDSNDAYRVIFFNKTIAMLATFSGLYKVNIETKETEKISTKYTDLLIKTDNEKAIFICRDKSIYLVKNSSIECKKLKKITKILKESKGNPTSLSILQNRYLLVGTSEPSIIVLDLILSVKVDEIEFNRSIVSRNYSSIYDIGTLDNNIFICRSDLDKISLMELTQN